MIKSAVVVTLSLVSILLNTAAYGAEDWRLIPESFLITEVADCAVPLSRPAKDLELFFDEQLERFFEGDNAKKTFSESHFDSLRVSLLGRTSPIPLEIFRKIEQLAKSGQLKHFALVAESSIAEGNGPQTVIPTLNSKTFQENLEHLAVSNFFFAENPASLPKFAKLQSLDIRFSEFQTRKNLHFILQMSGLRRLNLDHLFIHDELVAFNDLDAEILKSNQKLESLSIKGSDLSVAGVQSIAQISSLKHLRLGWNDHSYSPMRKNRPTKKEVVEILTLGKLSNLKTLEIE